MSSYVRLNFKTPLTRFPHYIAQCVPHLDINIVQIIWVKNCGQLFFFFYFLTLFFFLLGDTKDQRFCLKYTNIALHSTILD